jgi:hypothetical protein
MAKGIKFSEFKQVTDPAGFKVAGLSGGENAIIDGSAIGGSLTSENAGENISINTTDPNKPIISAIIPPPTITRRNVTEMFTFSPAVPKSRIVMEEDDTNTPMIRIFAEDNSGSVNDLTITASSGFGSLYGHSDINSIKVLGTDPDTGTDGIYRISITPETSNAKTVITVPHQVGNVDLTYFVGQTQLPSSYMMDNNGVYHRLGPATTPLSDMPRGGYYYFNNNIFYEYQIIELVLGPEYDGETTLSEGRLSGLTNASYIKLPRNISTFEYNSVAYPLSATIVLPEVPYVLGESALAMSYWPDGVDLSLCTSIGNYVELNYEKIILSSNLTHLGAYSLGYRSNSSFERREIHIGSLDINNVTVDDPATNFQYNMQIGSIYATTIELANAFKAKFPKLALFNTEIEPD